MYLEVGGKKRLARIMRHAWRFHSAHGFGSGREGAAGFRIIKNAWDNHYFHGFGSGRLASESSEIRRTVIILMFLEVGGRGAIGFIIIRNA